MSKQNLDDIIENCEENFKSKTKHLSERIAEIENNKICNGFFELEGQNINIFVNRSDIRENILKIISKIINDKLIFDIKIKEFGDLLNEEEKTFLITSSKSQPLTYDEACTALKSALELTQLRDKLKLINDKLKKLADNYSSEKIREKSVNVLLAELKELE